MSRLLFIFILTGFLLPPSTSNAQEITPEADRTFDTETFTLPGGRLGNNVNSIVQGPNGFMWFGSHGGVHRYDGYEFVTYKNVAWDTIGETTTLSYPYVENLFWDSHDKLWISTYGNGIYLFDPETEIFKHYPYDADNPGSVSHPRVLSAVEDNQGRMWFGTERGLNRLDPENQTFIKYFADPDDPNSLVNDDIRKLYLDKQGILWIGSGFAGFEARVNGSLSRYNPDSDNFTNFYQDEGELAGLDYSAARAIAEDSHGNFWVGTANGLNRVDKDKGTFELMKYDPGFPFAPGARDRVEPIVYSVLEDNSGGLWVGTVMAPNYPTHLLRYDYETQTSQVFPVQTSIWDMTQSADGTIWTAGAGVSGQVLRITPKSATYDLQGGDFYAQEFITSPLKAQFGIPINFFMRGPLSMTIDESNGDIWTTHSCLIQGGNYLFLAKYNPTSTKTQFFHLTTMPGQIDQSLFDNNWSTSGMAIDKKGRIWCSYIYDGVGLFSFDPQSNQVEHYLHDPADSTTISSDFIIRIIMDRNGDIWAGTGGTGLNRINPETGQITRYNFDIPETFDSNGWVISLLEARDGKIWASGELHDGGTPIIVIIDPENNDVSRLHLPLGNSFYSIRFMTQSPITGNVFFITEGGELWNFHPDTGKFNFFGQQGSPLPIEAIATLVCDDSGTFWASGANSGEFVRFGESFDYEKFFSREGYPNRRRHGMVGPDGQIYFINAQGWIHIDPKNLNLKSVADSSHLKLVDLYLLGKKQIPGKDYALPRPAPMMDAIELKHDAETFSFRYSIFNYHDDNIQFEYRLYPFENLWKITNLPVANYFRIPSGDYQFQVRHFNYSGASNENMLDIPVKILPPWWKTWWAYLMYGILLILAGFGVHRIQKERVIRAERNRNREKELEHAREIEKAYNDLQNTQAQLLQSEKMASLGELTAGIAHEIQNPLNFVNNFSEVNTELLAELKEEIKQKNYDEVESIADSLEENEQKILHHGHRAGAIVKSMLQHSRSSKGEREEVDLNELADEYLRLAYHGMRAKDKTFNANMKTDFDNDIGKLKLVPQDIGRVILNLITNAFYAVHQKKQKSNGVYAPEVSVSTKRENGKIELEVADNGTGMPEEVVNKIFQPFFTTKPTGEGTGLGLSLSYDIIKAHGGDMSVNSKEGEGTKFVIELPV